MENGSIGGEKMKQNVLERLATIEPWDLCSEAKVEKCRATRDLRSCARPVHHLLTSCGHACLCIECSQRCDICPICRTPITRAQPLRLRLYDECVEAGLLPSVQDDEFREREVEGPYWTLDAWRLCSFFDVSVDNGLASLVCHYVTDVCMDEGAVSSDPVVSMLLDGTVVKEWCKRTLVSTVRVLRDIYITKPAPPKADTLDRHGRKLQAVCYVLETLEAPLGESSPSFVELRQLLDSVRIVMQHLNVMTWCMRLRFLEDVQTCYVSFSHWKATFQQRKQYASARVWPDYDTTNGKMGSMPPGTLFIEDALSVGQYDSELSNGMLDLVSLRYAAYPGSEYDYPPESTRSAVDFLFLEGSPDDFFAKTAIFLYYLFDRHWTLPEGQWKHVIEDYVLTFSIPRQSMLESFVYYLLDNNTEAALEEACRWLPAIVGPNLHPKIARVLLERQRPNAALSVLQSTGRFTPRQETSCPVPLFEAVTVVRVLLESGILTEAYSYQQSHYSNVRKHEADGDDSSSRDWLQEIDVLVGEMCWFCIRRNFVVKMLELPWNSDEEKVLRKCLLQKAAEEPNSPAGGLLTAFYLQRCRFAEAFLVHQRIVDLEQHYMTNSVDIEAKSRLQRQCEQRTLLIEKSLKVLPEVERDRILNGEEQLQATCSNDEMEIIPAQERLRKEFSSPAAPTNLFIQTPSRTSDSVVMPSPSPAGKSNLRQPLGRPTPGKSPIIKSPLLAPSSPASPLLGKRLRYDADSRFSRQAGQLTQQQQSVPSTKSDRMVVTW